MTDTRTVEAPRAGVGSERAGVEVRRSARLRIGVALGGLVLFGAIILVITLWPQPVDRGQEGTVAAVLDLMHAVGVPAWFGYRSLEFSANVVMFLPLGFFAALLLPRRFRWAALALPPLVSAGVETAQLVFLEDRFATLLDVLANSLGGWIGALAAFLIVRKA